MNRTLAALGIAALTGTTMLSAAQAEPPKGPAPAEQMRPGPGEGHGPGGFFRGQRGEVQMRLAEKLSAAETLIGIRTNQIDAWRDYTNALLALFEPPAPPAPPAPGQDGERAFARQERMIAMINDRAAKAATLEKAITALKATLTPDQLDKLADVDLSPRRPHGPMGGMNSRDGMGQMGPWGGMMGGMMGGMGHHGGREWGGKDWGGHGPRGQGGQDQGGQDQDGPRSGGDDARGPAGGPPPAPDDDAQPDAAPNPG